MEQHRDLRYSNELNAVKTLYLAVYYFLCITDATKWYLSRVWFKTTSTYNSNNHSKTQCEKSLKVQIYQSLDENTDLLMLAALTERENKILCKRSTGLIKT